MLMITFYGTIRKTDTNYIHIQPKKIPRQCFDQIPWHQSKINIKSELTNNRMNSTPSTFRELL